MKTSRDNECSYTHETSSEDILTVPSTATTNLTQKVPHVENTSENSATLDTADLTNDVDGVELVINEMGCGTKSHMQSNKQDLRSKLCNWAVECNVNHSVVNSLLKLLHVHHPELPLDCRTLLNTNNNKQEKSGSYISYENGEMWYKGIVASISEILSHGTFVVKKPDAVFIIDIGIDGLPLFKSSSVSVWPIMGCIRERGQSPFLIAAYCGEDKPHCLEAFLQELVLEIDYLSLNPISYQKCCVKIKIGNFICDAPARSFLKCIKPHMGHYSCERCTVKGEIHERRMVFTDLSAPLRSDSSFTNRENPEHHTGTSPLEKCHTKMISQFPLDFMHLVCQGAMRRLLWFWIEEGNKSRLQLRKRKEISSSLQALRKYCPSDFTRFPRSLKQWKKFKATELRMFLLYVGPIVLKSILDEKVYDHFMLLSISIYVLVHPKFVVEKNRLSQHFLQKFVSQCNQIYGKKMVVYNIHNLIHLSDEAKQHGQLDNFSAFKFENFLKTVKSYVRSPYRPLQQIIRRDAEKSQNPSLIKNADEHIFKFPHTDGPTLGLNGAQFRKIILNKCVISCNLKDSCIKTRKGIFLVQNVIKGLEPENVHVIAKKFKIVEDWYTSPCRSGELNIFQVKEAQGLKKIHINEIEAKCFLLPVKDAHVCIPLAHFANILG